MSQRCHYQRGRAFAVSIHSHYDSVHETVKQQTSEPRERCARMITFVKRYRIRSPPVPSLFPTTTEAGEGAQNFARPMFRGGKCPFGRDWRLLDVFGNHLRRKGKSVICKRRLSRVRHVGDRSDFRVGGSRSASRRNARSAGRSVISFCNCMAAWATSLSSMA